MSVKKQQAGDSRRRSMPLAADSSGGYQKRRRETNHASGRVERPQKPEVCKSRTFSAHRFHLQQVRKRLLCQSWDLEPHHCLARHKDADSEITQILSHDQTNVLNVRMSYNENSSRFLLTGPMTRSPQFALR